MKRIFVITLISIFIVVTALLYLGFYEEIVPPAYIVGRYSNNMQGKIVEADIYNEGKEIVLLVTNAPTNNQYIKTPFFIRPLSDTKLASYVGKYVILSGKLVYKKPFTNKSTHFNIDRVQIDEHPVLIQEDYVNFGRVY